MTHVTDEQIAEKIAYYMDEYPPGTREHIRVYQWLCALRDERAETARLRDALEMIADPKRVFQIGEALVDGHRNDYTAIARAALEGEDVTK